MKQLAVMDAAADAYAADESIPDLKKQNFDFMAELQTKLHQTASANPAAPQISHSGVVISIPSAG